MSNSIEVYSGIDGYTKPLTRRIEAGISPIKQIISGTDVAGFHRQTNNLVDQIISQRAEKGLALQNLIRQEDKHLTVELTNPAVRKETRLLPEGFATHAMFAVFGDIVTLTSLNPDDTVGIMIDNPLIAETYRSMFDAIWNISSPI